MLGTSKVKGDHTCERSDREKLAGYKLFEWRKGALIGERERDKYRKRREVIKMTVRMSEKAIMNCITIYLPKITCNTCKS